MDNYNRTFEEVKQAIAEVEEEFRKSQLQRDKNSIVDRSFWITHEYEITRYISSKANNAVKSYLLEKMDMSTNLYVATMEETSKATNVTKRTVVDAFNTLQDEDYIRHYKRGIWMVNPKLNRKGSGGKYIGLIKKYYSLPQKRREKKDA